MLDRGWERWLQVAAEGPGESSNQWSPDPSCCRIELLLSFVLPRYDQAFARYSTPIKKKIKNTRSVEAAGPVLGGHLTVEKTGPQGKFEHHIHQQVVRSTCLTRVCNRRISTVLRFQWKISRWFFLKIKPSVLSRSREQPKTRISNLCQLQNFTF